MLNYHITTEAEKKLIAGWACIRIGCRLGLF